MITFDPGPERRARFFRLTTILAFAASLTSFLGLGYAGFKVLRFYDWFEQSPASAEWVGGSFVYGFGCHFVILAWVIQAILRNRDIRLPGCLALVMGILSTIFFLSDILGFREMVKEYHFNKDVESTRVWFILSFAIHIGFYSTLATVFARIFSSTTTQENSTTASTEGLFVSMNVAGAISAAIGFAVMLLQFDIKPLTRVQQKYLVLFESWFILAPYVLIAATWLWHAYRRGHLLDEKQRSDVNRAGVTTWLVSIPLMLVLFLIPYGDGTYPAATIWFPYYLFITLFVFSTSSLWFYNRT
jgi:hypothetical protein